MNNKLQLCQSFAAINHVIMSNFGYSHYFSYIPLWEIPSIFVLLTLVTSENVSIRHFDAVFSGYFDESGALLIGDQQRFFLYWPVNAHNIECLFGVLAPEHASLESLNL